VSAADFTRRRHDCGRTDRELSRLDPFMLVVGEDREMGLVADISAYRVPAKVERSGSQLFVRNFDARRDAYSSKEDVVVLSHWGQGANAVPL
jgi:hypothetical protein